MPGEQSGIWGWYPEEEKWVKIRVDDDGSFHVVGYIDKLNDIGDVDVAAPTDLYILYWNNSNSKWECRALSDWTVPAHKDRHDPQDGADPLDTAAPVKIGEANDIGASHSFPRADHVHEKHHAKYLDAEAKAAAVQAGAITNGVTKAPTHDAVFDVKATADAALPAVDKYTDAEAVDAMGALGDANPLNHDKAAEWGATEHSAIGDGAPHHAKYTDAEAVAAVKADGNLPVVTITFIIDGGGSAITTGEKGHLEIPFAGTINRVTMMADQSGSIVVDIWKDTYANFPPTDADSITAAAPPTITTAQKSQDSTLTDWTTAIAAGDILAFNVDSITTITRVIISLKVTKT